MSWNPSKITSSLMSLWSDSVRGTDVEGRTREIRQALLDCLALLGDSEEATRVWRRVHYAADVQALWYLRSDVLAQLASHLGQTAAQARIAPITTLFKGLLPASQMPRPTRLSR